MLWTQQQLHLQAPEICDALPHSTKSDVWALGCILFELTTLKRAFDGSSLPSVIVKILHGSIQPLPSKYSSSVRKLVQSMLSQSPAHRPSIDEILKQPWLRRHLERFADMMMSFQYQQMTAKSAAAPINTKHHDVPTAGELAFIGLFSFSRACS